MIKLIILTGLWCNGLTFLTEKGELLEFVGRAIGRLPLIISKPLLTCISCMASIHTAIVLVLYGWIYNCLSWQWMKQYFIVAICSVFVNGMMFLVRDELETKFFKRKNVLR